ncbi:hypothetical protein HRI_003965900 [Hibiscus trionum]|uniref:Argonaute linker 2 domain-containing protein n=1 Tax=Hibiscus trionum TaxID=183268 RepID=A0A9W7MJK8_HIBTR|nr:hypothetical protein HRI_003965900 [Hibiscus trionum]
MLMQMVKVNNFEANDLVCKEFGIQVHKELALVDARVLPPPMLKYHDSGRERSVCPNLGSWNMINKVFRNTLSISIRASRDDKIDQTLLDIYREFAGKNMQILGGAKCI